MRERSQDIYLNQFHKTEVERDLKVIYPVSLPKQKSLQNIHDRQLTGVFLTITRDVFVHFFFILFFYFLQPHLWHVEVPRLKVESELQLRPTPQPQELDPSYICDLR